ncbi:MAG: PAS domain S-box protein [Desulforhopalus sp.]
MKDNHDINQPVSPQADEGFPANYHNLFLTMSQGIVYQSADGRITSANPSAERILGLTLDQMQGRTSMDPKWRTLREDGSEFPGSEHPAMQALATGQPVLGTVMGVYQHNRDQIRWLMVDAVPEFRKGEDQPWQVYTAFTDITERKKVEAALRKSEERFRMTFDACPDAININRLADGMYVEVNDGFSFLTGYNHEEVIGRTSADIDIWYDLQDRQVLVEGLLKNGCCNDFEARFRRKNGKVGYGRMSARLITMDNTPHILSVTRDVTEQAEAVEALRSNEKLLDSILRTAPVAIGVLIDQVFFLVNRRMCEMTGYAQEELVGKDTRMLYLSDEDCQLVGTEKYRQINEHNIGSIETRWQRKDGEIIDILICSSPIKSKDTSAGCTFTALDISERKKSETDREKLQAQLLQAQKMESVGRLAGGVAHDFNNMLTAILGHADLAMKQCASNKHIHGNLEVIKNAAQRSAGLVRQLLAFARKQTVEPKTLDLNDYMVDLLKMLNKLIGEDIDLSWEPGGELWPIRIDPTQIDQLLANLCINARDAIDGIGKITIETRNTVFDAEYCAVHPGFRPGEFVNMCVSDNGSGIDKQVLEHIFEPFFTTKETGKGTGLGLSSVYGIVKQNEGFINVYSEPGKGSTFKIYLPRLAEGTLASLTEKLTEIPRGKRELILLVEDEAVILNVGKEMLEQLGYIVLAAGSPIEAIEIARNHSDAIQLLVTDVIMPEMNGRDLARILVDVIPGLQCLFTSGYTANVIAHHGVLNRGIHFLQKPFSSNDLALAVRRILEEKKND